MEYKNNIIWVQNTLISELLLSAIRHKGHSPKKIYICETDASDVYNYRNRLFMFILSTVHSKAINSYQLNYKF